MIPTPRDYQTRAIRAAYASIKSGKRCPLIVAPTGAGKSTILGLIARDAVSRGKRVAAFAHRRELCDQLVATFERCELRVGYGGAGKAEPVQVVSTQGATACDEVPDADLVFLDEAHHYAADEWGRIPAAYPKAWIVGATATPERTDGRGMGHLFDDLIVVAQPRELVTAGHLVDCGKEDVIRPPEVQQTGYLAQPPVDMYKAHGNGGRNIVFASTVEHACIFVADFKRAGIDAHIVHGGLPSDVRAKNLADFAAGRVRVLVNVFVLTEGFDCPAVDVVTIARKMGSCAMYIQCAGRGLRPSPGKSRMVLLDLAGVSHLHGLPTDDRIFSLDGIGIRLASEAGPRFCRACGTLLAEVGPCSECKRSRRGAVKDPKYSRHPMEKFARYKTDSEAERAERLAKFIRNAKNTVNKDGSRRDWRFALGQYKGVYGTAPPRKILQVAMELAQGPARGEERRGW